MTNPQYVSRIIPPRYGRYFLLTNKTIKAAKPYASAMRCKTPIILSLEKSWFHCGNEFRKSPMAKMSRVRLPILSNDSLLSWLPYFEKEKNMEAPTTKRKNGNTRSVGVHPCQAACSSGA